MAPKQKQTPNKKIQNPNQGPKSKVTSVPKKPDQQAETYKIVESNLRRVFEMRAAQAGGSGQDKRAGFLKDVFLKFYKNGSSKSVEKAKGLYKKILDAMLKKSMSKDGRYEKQFDSIKPEVSFKTEAARKKAWEMLSGFVLSKVPSNVKRDKLDAYMKKLISDYKQKLKDTCYAWYGKNVSVADLDNYKDQIAKAFFGVDEFKGSGEKANVRVEFVGELPIQVATMRKSLAALKGENFNKDTIGKIADQLKEIDKLSVSNAGEAKLRFKNLKSYLPWVEENGSKKAGLLKSIAAAPGEVKTDLKNGFSDLDRGELAAFRGIENIGFGNGLEKAKGSYSEQMKEVEGKVKGYLDFRKFRTDSYKKINGDLAKIKGSAFETEMKKAYKNLKENKETGLDSWKDLKKKIEEFEKIYGPKVKDFLKKKADDEAQKKRNAELAKMTKGDIAALQNPGFYKFVLGIPVIGAIFAASRGISNSTMVKLGLNPKKYFLLNLFRDNPNQTKGFLGKITSYWKSTRLGKWLDFSKKVDGKKVLKSKAVQQLFKEFKIKDDLGKTLAGSKVPLDEFLAKANNNGFKRYKGFVEKLRKAYEKNKSKTGFSKTMPISEFLGKITPDDLKSKSK